MSGLAKFLLAAAFIGAVIGAGTIAAVQQGGTALRVLDGEINP
jgi:uncharacterized membrane protein YczE